MTYLTLVQFKFVQARFLRQVDISFVPMDTVNSTPTLRKRQGIILYSDTHDARGKIVRRVDHGGRRRSIFIAGGETTYRYVVSWEQFDAHSSGRHSAQ